MHKHTIKTGLLAVFMGFMTQLSAQLTLRITSIPVNTPIGATLYVAGNFNTWNPSDPTKTLTPIGSGQYEITLFPAAGTVEFKCTRGSWATVEGNAGGSFQPNHTVTYTGAPQTVEVPILSWEDLGGNVGTNEPNVSIIDPAFYMPQLNRNRRIWIYLPPDYTTTAKHYPVLYMHDGQNLFDTNTAFSGEWEVDESLTELFNQGDYGCIVVGVDNGGASRLDEYSPWVNPTYGGGEGAQYVDFLTNTLKPYIDANYRTFPGRQYTGIMGSSMGGLISQYALMERQDVYSKAGIFSPAFWFAGNNSATHTINQGKQADARVYYLAGGNEPASVETDMQVVADAMLTAGFSADELYWHVPTDGDHSEWFWKREFPAAYQWLFQNTVSTEAAQQHSAYQAFPNPTSDGFRISGPEPAEPVHYRLTDVSGKAVRDSTARTGEAVSLQGVATGVYFLKITGKKGMENNVKMVVQE